MKKMPTETSDIPAHETFAKPATRTLRPGSYLRSASCLLFKAWLYAPMFLRTRIYKLLVPIVARLYGNTGSDRMHRLPFNTFLRVSGRDWAPKLKAEVEALRLVQQYTNIPAPKALDFAQSSDSSYLLMTALPGEIIGRRIHCMTDKQLHTTAEDLKRHIKELRHIPNRTESGYQICNVLGGGILDWRIGDSQREELRFQSENEFNAYLTKGMSSDHSAWGLISKSHGVKHDLVFTHADLNLRNILVDESVKISGIVDWECAGWYPEYWEYTKAHFGVRYTVRWLADVIDQIFPNYRDELLAENILSDLAPPS